MKLALVLLALLVTHYGYEYATDDPRIASDLFYALRGWEGAVLFLVLGMTLRGKLAKVICGLGFWEELQTTACIIGADSSLEIPLSSGLCVERFGILPYAAILAAVIVYFWSRRHEREA